MVPLARGCSHLQDPQFASHLILYMVINALPSNVRLQVHTQSLPAEPLVYSAWELSSGTIQEPLKDNYQIPSYSDYS